MHSTLNPRRLKRTSRGNPRALMSIRIIPGLKFDLQKIARERSITFSQHVESVLYAHAKDYWDAKTKKDAPS